MKHNIQHAFILSAVVVFSGCTDDNSYDRHYTLAIIIIVLIIFIFLALGIYTNMLREKISDCEQFDINAVKQEKRQKRPLLNKANPFSFTKVQLASWTAIIACSYIYLSLCRGDCAGASISQTALILMGISAGTATASALIDKRDIQNNVDRHQNHPSEGFLTDILSDSEGISVHRFQNLVWTIIAMIIYVAKVAHEKTGCELPELGDTLLILTGISSATFLTLRAGENDPKESREDQVTSPK